MPTAGARPIPSDILDNEIKNFNYLNITTLQEYLDTYTKWILNSKRNKISGLENYKFRSFIHGTIQCFDHFYLKYSTKRFRFFKGEFMYHRASMKYNLSWKYLNDDDLSVNDAVIISIPFSDSGKIKGNLTEILNTCEELKIPVLLDLAYYPISKNINIDVNYQCIDSICTSISKAFYGAQNLRCGIRYQRQNLDDGIDVFNSVEMVPTYNMTIANHLMTKYSVDYNWNTYESFYSDVCKELNLDETDCIIFGTSSSNYQQFNRGNAWNRVCISEELSRKIYVSTQSQ